MKKQNIIIIAVFAALILGLGLLGWLTPDQAFSENENRYLQEPAKAFRRYHGKRRFWR